MTIVSRAETQTYEMIKNPYLCEANRKSELFPEEVSLLYGHGLLSSSPERESVVLDYFVAYDAVRVVPTAYAPTRSLYSFPINCWA